MLDYTSWALVHDMTRRRVIYQSIERVGRSSVYIAVATHAKVFWYKNLLVFVQQLGKPSPNSHKLIQNSINSSTIVPRSGKILYIHSVHSICRWKNSRDKQNSDTLIGLFHQANWRAALESKLASGKIKSNQNQLGTNFESDLIVGARFPFSIEKRGKATASGQNRIIVSHAIRAQTLFEELSIMAVYFSSTK